MRPLGVRPSMPGATVLHLYAITDHPELPLPAGPGLQDAALVSIAHQDIAAVASRLTCPDVRPTEADLWRHEAVVESLMADRTALPARFGAALPDEAGARAVLAERHAEFLASLCRVRGRVELGLRVLWREGGRHPTGDGRAVVDQPSPGSGRAYLMARLREARELRTRRRRAEELAMALHTPLARLASESAHQILITPRLLLTGAYLIAEDQVAPFRQEVEALSAAHSALRLLCTGPWPAYSFATTAVEEMASGRSGVLHRPPAIRHPWGGGEDASV